MIVFLLYTQTRAGWVALTVELFVFAVFMVKKHFKRQPFEFVGDRQRLFRLWGH